MDETSRRILPNAERMGVLPGTNIIAVDAPPDYHRIIGRLPRGSFVLDRLEYNSDCIHLFVRDRKTLSKKFPYLKKNLYERGMIWVSWPASPSGDKTDLDESAVRETGLASGLVDVEALSLDDNWMAMKFIYRIKDFPFHRKKDDSGSKAESIALNRRMQTGVSSEEAAYPERVI